MSAKTKTVGGKVLSKSDFAWAPSDDPADWKLQIDTCARAKDALSRFSQTDGIPDDEKKGVAQKIVDKCEACGIDTTGFEKENGLGDADDQNARPQIEELRRQIPRIERRVVPVDRGRLELRTAGDTKKIGMMIPFRSPSHVIYGFTERIAPGAFARTIKNGAAAKGDGDIVSLWNHDPNWVLGRQANRTLTLAESDAGLDGEAMLDPDNRMHDVFAANVARRDVTGASFGFETIRDEWKYNEDGSAERTLLEVKLFDVSPVTYPAYPASDAESRSLLEVAAVRAGVDLGALASYLGQLTEGKVPQAVVAEFRALIARLEGMVPAPPVPPVDWAARLRLRERTLATP